ncbi:hypothetical protein ACWCYY_18250 [Kitasatospora sp. NPDC001664]
MSLRDLDLIDRIATAVEERVYRYTPAEETEAEAAMREAAERSATARVANEVPGYVDGLPSIG